MKGNRRDGVKPMNLETGDYAVGEHEVWARLPTGDLARIPTNPGAAGPVWGIEHHDDGTITLEPSINMHPVPGHAPGWHGWLRAGVWSEA